MFNTICKILLVLLGIRLLLFIRDCVIDILTYDVGYRLRRAKKRQQKIRRMHSTVDRVAAKCGCSTALAEQVKKCMKQDPKNWQRLFEKKYGYRY